MKRLIASTATLALALLPVEPALAYSHSNRYGGSTSHNYYGGTSTRMHMGEPHRGKPAMAQLTVAITERLTTRLIAPTDTTDTTRRIMGAAMTATAIPRGRG